MLHSFIRLPLALLLLVVSMAPIVLLPGMADALGTVDRDRDVSGISAPPPSPCDAGAGAVSVSTALLVLRSAVGAAGLCSTCGCDVDSNGAVTVADALRVLTAAIGADTVFLCPACPCVESGRVPAGTSPRGVSAADVNGDGHLDLVTANTESDDVVVMLGGPDGARSGGRFFVGETPLSLTLVDLDGDGHRDAITPNALPGNLSTLLGNADGTFGRFDPGFMTAAGLAPISVDPVDLDDDGVLDLVVANSLSDDISLLLGNGDGSFRSFDQVAVGVGPRWAAAGDLNDDGKIDVVSADRDSDTVSVLLGDGTGSVALAHTIDVAEGPYHVSLGDLDGDGILDAVIPSFFAGEVSVLIGLGDGSFAAPVAYPTFGDGIASVVADLDGDGILDAAIANLNGDFPNNAGSVAVLLGNGDGTLAPTRIFPIGKKPRALTVADVNEDGLVDIVAALSKSDETGVLFGVGGGQFTSDIGSPGANFSVSIASTDLDSDGRVDLVMAGDRGWISRHMGTEGGFFPGVTRQSMLRSPRVILEADLDVDGNADIVVLNEVLRFCALEGNARSCQEQVDQGQSATPYGLSVRLGVGDGSFGEEISLDGVLTRDADVGDLDGDGIPDIVAFDDSLQLPVFLRGMGDGTFELAPPTSMVAGTRRCRIGPLTTGGDNFVACLAFDPGEHGEIEVFRITEEGAFDLSTTAALALEASEVLLGDIDADGRTDLVAVDRSGSGIQTWPGRGDGRFGSVTISPVAVGLEDATLADLDADGAPDLVALKSRTVVALRGSGTGTFSEPSTLLSRIPSGGDGRGSLVTAFSVADYDGDGTMDLVGTASRSFAPAVVTRLSVGNCLGGW